MIKVHGLGAVIPDLKGIIRDVRAVWATTKHPRPDAYLKRNHVRPAFLPAYANNG